MGASIIPFVSTGKGRFGLCGRNRWCNIVVSQLLTGLIVREVLRG